MIIEGRKVKVKGEIESYYGNKDFGLGEGPL